jgi:GT2 family glycosyltransferase/glycosyltransferase involved in cell wall biosynthesis
MNILLLMDCPILPTGYASTCRLTARELAKRGHKVSAMAFNGGPHISDFLDWEGMRIVPNHALSRNPNAIYGDAEGVKWAYEQVKPDILFWHNDSYRYSYLNDLPEEITKKSVFWLPFEGENADMLGVGLFSKCAATRFVTNHALTLHKEFLKEKDIGFVPHAINLDYLGPCPDKAASKASKKLGVENKFLVVRVDRHQPRKYWDRTLRAFAKFAEGKDDVFLLCKCDPRDITMYKVENGKPAGVDLSVMAKELGIENKIKFDDFFFDDSYMAPAFFHPADVFLTTTSGEGYGLNPVQAMACGIPVIAPDTPVLPEVLGGDNGKDSGGAIFAKLEGRTYYTPMHVWHNLVDIDDVVAKLEFAYQDWKSGGKRLAEIGKRGMEIARRKYSPKAVYDQWDQVFMDVVDQEKLVSLVTVVYNLKGEEQIGGEDGIEKFRASIEEHVKTPYEWIIVDNGSPQREVTRKWMRQAAEGNPRIKPVYLDINMGFAGGNNVGIAETRGKWVVLANPDSEALDPAKQAQPGDFLRMLVDRAKKDPRIGIVGMTLNQRDDVMKGLTFPYFCCVLITKECLKAVEMEKGKWLDEKCWPAYYEDSLLCLKAKGKGFKIVGDGTITFYHKSGGTNKYAIEGNEKGPFVEHLRNAIDRLEKEKPDMADWPRKRAELASGGMQGLISGNISYLNQQYGPAARAKIKIVWHVHVGDGVGFSQLAEGCAPALEEAGFDVYVNDWSNGANIEDPRVRRLWEKYKKANLNDDLSDAIHIVCWLMETFLNVDEEYKIGISLCESTKVRESYLNACNSMDRILTFSEFCRGVQKNSGFKVPIDVIPPAVHPIYLKYHERPRRDKFTFLNVGVSQFRKDTQRLVDAFCEAFPKGAANPPDCEPNFPIKPANVELVLKSNNFGELTWVEPYKKRANIRTIFTGQDSRAERQNFTMEEMRALYDEADAYVHPSHGEGIGMPLLEAAATGLPVIFTNWSSPAEYFNESNSYPISLSPYPGTTFTKAYPGAPGDNGLWANHHVGHNKFIMYHVIRNRGEATRIGKVAAEHMRKNFTWENTVREMIPLVFEWEADRKAKSKKGGFDPVTFVKPTLKPVQEKDRVMVDLASRDRHLPLCCLLVSLLNQTFRNWDITIQCDDADESMPNDFMIMSLMGRIQHEGHGWRIIRSFRQGPHMAHDRTLQQTTDDPSYKYKLICRIDDDIILKPDYLEKLFKVFLDDKDAQVAAVGGVYLDPRRSDGDQVAPANYEQDINYAGLIDHNVPWPYVCRYPAGTAPRAVEHLYSSFMYRVEVANAIGGYCKKFSQIGHREESDFSYRFFLAGFRQYIHPEAVGYHFSAPSGGIRDGAIVDRNTLATMDHQIYEKRVRRWKERAKLRQQMDSGQKALPPPPEKPKEEPKVPATQPAPLPPEPRREEKPPEKPAEPKRETRPADPPRPTAGDSSAKPKHAKVKFEETTRASEKERVAEPATSKGKIVTVINGGKDLARLQAAVDRFKAISDDVYVTCEVESAKGLLGGRVAMVATSPDESALLTAQLASEGDHEFVMTVTDSTRFQDDPRPVLDDGHDDYVFECYRTYVPGRVTKDSRGLVTFVQDDSFGETLGPELENRCLIHRRKRNGRQPIERVKYSDIVVIEDDRIPPVDGKSLYGNDLVRLSDFGNREWTKVCTYQFPEGRLAKPRAKVMRPIGDPLVSIIVPTAGRLRHLKRCVSSIYSYTPTPFEIIIVDNDSQDGTFKYLEEQQFRNNFHGIRLNANVGYQRAVNYGATRAKGKYLLLFNDDAWVESMMPDGRDWVRMLVDELEADPKVGLVGVHQGRSLAFGTPMLFFWCVMMRRSTYDQVGPLDDLTFTNYGGDDDYQVRLARAGFGTKFIPGYDGKLRHLMNLVPPEQKRAELEESVRRLREKYPDLCQGIGKNPPS